MENTPSQAVVQSGGHTFRAKAEIVKAEFARGETLHNLLLTADRLPSNELAITHESIANTLGVRREAFTQAAGKLQQAGFIRCRRGHITVIDRHGLESRTCECYAVVKKELDGLRLH